MTRRGVRFAIVFVVSLGQTFRAWQAMTHRPTTGFFSPVLLCLVSISAATGCTAMSDADNPRFDLFRDQQSTAEARTQVERWITPDMTVADAMQVLGSRGFACKATKPSSGGVQSSILCLYSTPQPPPPDQRVTAPATPINWFLTLNSKDGATINDFQIARSPKEIGG